MITRFFKQFSESGDQSAAGSKPVIEEGACKLPDPEPSCSDRDADRKFRSRERIKLDLLIHDFKIPLAVIEAGLSSLLGRPEKYGPLTPAQAPVIERALRNTKVIQTLVNDALELGRSEAGIINPVPVTPSQLVEQTLVEMFDLTDGLFSEKIKSCENLALMRDALRERGILLRIGEDLWCETLCLDQSKIRQILRNLLNNAMKYRRNTVELKIEAHGGYLVISVADDGEGIPPRFHERIFESYFQMDASDICSVRGHGLGLAGVMVLVEDMGCRLSLESDRGKGTRFIVEIPLDSSSDGK